MVGTMEGCECAGTHRLFLCARCRRQVRICSHCDRGQIYCPYGCSEASREESIRKAGEKYQQTPQGAENHAARQRRYRERLQERDVTHQGSAAPPAPPSEEAREPAGERATPAAALETVADRCAATDVCCGDPADTAPRDAVVPPVVEEGYRCDFCGRVCGVYSGVVFLRGRYHRDFTRN